MNQSHSPLKSVWKDFLCVAAITVLSSSFAEEMLLEAKPNVLLLSTGLSQDQTVALAD